MLSKVEEIRGAYFSVFGSITCGAQPKQRRVKFVG